MEYITTTELRTKTSQLVKTLKKQGKVTLIHRSQVIGVVDPIRQVQAPPITLEKFSNFLDGIKPKKIIPRSQREQTYRRNLMKKYGKHLS